jgi:hypothetical protein
MNLPPNAAQFIEEYIELCKKHELMICASVEGYYYISDTKPTQTYDAFEEQQEDIKKI